jgi:hypothetical protein
MASLTNQICADAWHSRVRFRTEGETVAFNQGIEAAPQEFMHSPPHRATIVNPNCNTVGIGRVARVGTLGRRGFCPLKVKIESEPLGLAGPRHSAISSRLFTVYATAHLDSGWYSSRLDDVLKQAGDLTGTVIVACSLPMDAHNTKLIIGTTNSGAEELAKKGSTGSCNRSFADCPQRGAGRRIRAKKNTQSRPSLMKQAKGSVYRAMRNEPASTESKAMSRINLAAISAEIRLNRFEHSVARVFPPGCAPPRPAALPPVPAPPRPV